MCGYAERRNEQGFLLLEALIGLAIIGAVAIALLTATGNQTRAASKAANLVTAGALAQDRLAGIRLLEYEEMLSPPDSLLAGAFPAPFQDFSWSASVTSAEDEYDLFALRVEVTGRGERYLVETLLHRPDPTRSVAVGAGGGDDL